MWLFRRNNNASPKSEKEQQVERDLENIKASEGAEGSDVVPDDYVDEDRAGSKPASPTGGGDPEPFVITEIEKAALAQMKAKLDPEAKPGVPLDAAFDWTLIRFLRARKYDIDQAIDMYTKMLEWRKENQIDKMTFEEDPREKIFQCIAPHRYHGVDKDGYPIYFERTGQIRVGDLLKHMEETDIVMRHVRFLEYMIHRMIAESQRQGRYIGKMVMIHDLSGMKYTIETAGMRCFRRTTHIDQEYYPECLRRMIIINAPMSFRGVWAVCRPWLDAKTRAKVEILGANYQARLKELIPPEHLPEIYGGACKCEGVFENGDTCFPPVRDPVTVDPAAAPPAWVKVSREPTDLEGGENASPLAPPKASTETAAAVAAE